MKQQDYLFVYGTLRKDYSLKLKDKVADNIEFLGRAKVGASLYDIGRYPGAIRAKEKSDDEIVGDVFIVRNPDSVFKVLDKYEGDEFVRDRKRVKLRSGRTVNAWIYWYDKNTAGKKRINYKDYLNYLRYKKTA